MAESRGINDAGDLRPTFNSPVEKRELLRKHVLQGVKDLFPIIGDHRELHLEDATIETEELDFKKHKQALLAGGSLTEPVKANLVIKDKQGNVIHKKNNHVLLKAPVYTDFHSFVLDGNEYVFKNQLRTLPGVYTRTRENEELESSFNLAKGENFRLSMDPTKGHMHMEYGTSKIPLYPVLRSFGLTHGDISQYWGKKLADRNEEEFQNSAKTAVSKLYERIVSDASRADKLSLDEKAGKILTEYTKTVLDPNTTKSTLGKEFSNVTPEALLAASKKILKVYNKEEDEDDRDSLEFQKVMGPEDFFKERIKLQSRGLKYKLKSKLDLSPDPQVQKILPSSSLSPVLKSFITTSRLSTIPSQINPVEIIDTASSVTRLGEGGISSERAVPAKLRQIHPSHFGIIDQFRTPEGSNAGVDVRFTTAAHRDSNGQLYTLLRNAKTKEHELVPAQLTMKSVVAFPHQDTESGNVDVIHNGKVKKVKPKDVQYIMPRSEFYSGVSSSLIPFVESSQGNRLLMGSKMVGQALPLVDRETPLVQVSSDWEDTHEGKPEKSMEHMVAKAFLPVYNENTPGVVKEVTEDKIIVTGEDGEDYQHNIPKRMPMASKTYFSQYPTVKVGDKVKKGDVLADSNFTKDKTLAMGKNLKVAYLSYHGHNSNDAVVLSKAAANKLTSLHMVKKVIDLDDQTYLDDKKHSANFPRVFDKDQYTKLEKGVIKPGMKLAPGDPIATVVRKVPPSIENQLFGRIHKSLARSYNDSSLTWDKEVEGEVVDVVNTGKRLTVTVKYKAPMGIGDKVTNRYGGKGVVSKIIEDESMPQDENGKPIDLLWSSLGVVGRINPAQILETGLAKAAEKKGTTYQVKNFKKVNNLQWVRDEMKKAGVTEKEVVTDPITGKKIKDIFVGPQYIYKLFKSTDTNYSARGVEEGYDINQQPSKGGDEGAKGTGIMEINALLAANARNFVRDNAVITGTRNSEYWKAVQLGLPLPAPKTTFAFDKFTAMLKGSGLKMDRKGDLMTLAPLLDSEVEKMSNGEVSNGKMVVSKDLSPEKGGLFDLGVTGGLTGKHWSHIDLGESFMNPLFEDPARRFLGMSKAELRDAITSNGGDSVRQKLNDLDLASKEKELSSKLQSLKGSEKDDAVKQLKAIRALKEQNLKPGEAYMMKKVPVLPPQFRPVVPSPRGDLLIADVNHLYKDAILAKEKLQEVKDLGLPDEDLKEIRGHVQDSLAAVIGTSDPVSSKSTIGDKKGLVKTIVGTKEGYYNGKLIANRLDLTARGTAAPDPNLGMDEVGLPEEMMWSMYHPFLVKNLVKKGYTALRAKEEIEKKTMTARQELITESKVRPVILNRAPTLHKYNMVGVFPKPIAGKTIRVNPFIEPGMNLDYDGDALQVYLPASQEAIKEAKNMTTSKNLFGEQSRNHLWAEIRMDAKTGLIKAGTAKPTGDVIKFKNKREALAAYRRGEVTINSNVEIEEDDGGVGDDIP